MSPTRILVVEDDPVIALLLENLVCGELYECVGTVASGPEAITLAEASRPHLAIMDIALAGEMDGIETARILSERFGVQIVYLTGSTDRALFERARAISPIAYLIKPFEEFALKQAIEVALDRLALMQRLQASEAHLAEAQAVAHLGSWQWDLVQDRIVVSDELLRLLNLQAGQFEPRFDTFLALATEEDRPRMLAAVETLVRGDDPGDVDIRLAGTPARVLRVRGKARFDAQGQACELLGTARDISDEWRVRQAAERYREQLEASVAERTAELSETNAQLQAEVTIRRRAEGNLRYNEARYRGLIENLPEAVLVLQNDRIVFANPMAANLLGVAGPKSLQGRSIGDLVLPEYHSTCEHCKLAALAGEHNSTPTYLQMRRHDGSCVEVESLTFAFDYEGLPAVLSVVRDLTARRAAERTAERFRVALDSSPDAVFLIDPTAMRFLDVNETACNSLGYERDELLRLPPQHIKPHFNQVMLSQRYAAVLASQPGEDIILTEHQRKDGSTFPVEIRLRPFAAEGQPLMVAVARDVTQRQRTEAALSESNERFEQLAANVSEAFWIRDLTSNRFLYVSPAYAILYDKPVASLYRHPRSFLSAVHPDDLDRVTTAYERLGANGQPVELEYRVVSSHGQVRWLWVRTFPIHDSAGRIYRMAGIAQDITQRRASEEQYRNIIQASMDGFWVVDGRGGLCDCNEASCRMLGYERDELLAMTVPDIEAMETPTETGAHIQRVIELGSDRFETRHRRKDGRIIEVEVSIYFQPGSDGGRIYAFVRDITARKQAEHALRESEARFSTVFHAAPIGIAITAIKDGRVIDTNQSIQTMLGYASNDLLGHTTLELGIWPDPQQRGEVIERLRQAGRLNNLELSFRRKDGSLRDGLVSMESITLGGEPHLLSLLVDITDRRQAEAALRESRADLERAQAVGQIGSWRLDVQHDVLTWSEETHRIFALPPHQAMTYETFLAAVHADDRAYVDRQWQQALRGEPYDIEHRILVGGQVKWVRERAALEFDLQGQLLGGFGTVQDITERKWAEEALRISEARSRSILRAAPVGIGVLVERAFQEVNEAMTTITGYAREELVGQSARMIYPSQAEFDRVGTVKYQQIREQGIGSVETRWQRKDGTLIHVALSSSPITASDFSQGITFTAQDITAIKQIEQERLAHEAIQRDALVREVHHRIKNNLQGVIGLLRQHIADHPEAQPPIEAAIAHINTIGVVHGLQSRMPQNELRLRELLQEITTAAATLAMIAWKPPIDDTLAGDVWLDSGAAVTIALILNELVHNALKHGRSGVDIALTGDSQRATIQVRNTGGPLPANFDLDSGQGCGTGLGLVRTLLPRRGATLRIQYLDGHICAAFTLTPPVIADLSHTTPAEPTRKEPA